MSLPRKQTSNAVSYKHVLTFYSLKIIVLVSCGCCKDHKFGVLNQQKFILQRSKSEV